MSKQPTRPNTPVQTQKKATVKPTATPTSAAKKTVVPKVTIPSPTTKQSKVKNALQRQLAEKHAVIATKTIPKIVATTTKSDNNNVVHGIRETKALGDHQVRSGLGPGSRKGLQADELMRRMNLYYQTLNAPAEVVGVRIPDGNDFETVVFTVLYRTSMLVGTTDGTAAMIIGMGGETGQAAFLIPNPTPNDVGNPADVLGHVLGYVSNPVNCDAATPFGVAANATSCLPVRFPSWTDAIVVPKSFVDQVRVVSAGVSAMSAANTLSDQGSYVAAFLPQGLLDAGGPDGTVINLSELNQDTILTIPGSLRSSINEHKGISMSYTPTNPLCYQYSPFNNIPVSISEKAAASPGGFIICAFGASANTTINVEIVVNYEGIPCNNTLNFFPGALDSVVDDPIAVAEALNLRDSEDSVKEDIDGYAGLDGGERTSKGGRKLSAPHPLLKALTPHFGHGTNPSLGGFAVHAKIRRFSSKKGKDKGGSHAEKSGDQGNSMFSQVVGMLGDVAVRAGIDLLKGV